MLTKLSRVPGGRRFAGPPGAPLGLVIAIVVLLTINIAANAVAQKVWPTTWADPKSRRVVYVLVFLASVVAAFAAGDLVVSHL